MKLTPHARCAMFFAITAGLLTFGLVGCGSESGEDTSTTSGAEASPTGLAGTYEVEGTNPDDGSVYTGTVEVSGTGPSYTVAWTIALEQSHVGRGTLEGTTFTVTYEGDGVDAGTATYTQQEDGRLVGTWGADGSELGTETWTPV